MKSPTRHADHNRLMILRSHLGLLRVGEIAALKVHQVDTLK